MEKQCKKKCYKDLIILELKKKNNEKDKIIENQNEILKLYKESIKNKDDTIVELLGFIRDLGGDVQQKTTAA